MAKCNIMYTHNRTAVLASTVPYCIHKICKWNGKL